MRMQGVIESLLHKRTKQQVLEHNHPLSSVLNSMILQHEEPACFFDFKGDVLISNNRLPKLLGFTTSENHLGMQQVYSQLFSHFQSDGAKIQADEDVLVHNDGRHIPVSITHIPITYDNTVGSLCYVSLKSKNEVFENNALIDEYMFDTINQLDAAVWVVDIKKYKVVFVSDAIQHIFETSPKDIGMDTLEKVVHPDDLDGLLQARKRLLTEGFMVHTYRIVVPSGKVKWVKDHTITVKNSHGDLIRMISSFEDMTQQRVLKQKLENVAMTDLLTQLPNFNAFNNSIKKELSLHAQNHTSFSIFLVDIDDLNQINFSFHSDMGDEVMKILAARMANHINNYGTLFRELGDTFLAIVNHRPRVHDYLEIAQRMMDIIEEPISIDGNEFYLTASIGISVYPDDGKNKTTLLKNAHTALKRAKLLGKGNCQLYSASLNIETYKSFQLESDLRKAFETNELYLDYQPKVDVKTQKAIGAEALIRWKHPVWGIVSPDEFIPIAESRSLIRVLSKFVINHVIKQAGEWVRKGIPFKHVSFNLSPNAFFHEDLVDQIKASLKKYKVSPALIEIEVTEGSLLHATEMVQDHLQRLKSMGIKIALDDFGTGYSSIHYLKQYPIDIIKIDRSFIEGITEEGSNATITKSLIELSKALEKTVVAEGVEDRTQYDILKKMGCDLIQGYLFSKPVSPKELEELFLLEKIRTKKSNTRPKVERRKYFRLKLPLPLLSEMTILSINKKDVSLGSTEVLVQDIGLGGLRFVSNLRLTANPGIIYGFKTRIMDKDLNLSGKVVRSEEISVGIFEYGIEFLIDERDRDALTRLLNQLTPKIKVNPLFHEGNFITEDPMAYIRKRFIS